MSLSSVFRRSAVVQSRPVRATIRRLTFCSIELNSNLYVSLLHDDPGSKIRRCSAQEPQDVVELSRISNILLAAANAEVSLPSLLGVSGSRAW